MSQQESKNVASSKSVAGLYQPTLQVRDDFTLVGIQINATEACLCNQTFVDECADVQQNTITIASHGYETGLKGTLDATTGCAATTPSACISACCNLITEACHGFTTGERGQFTTTCALPGGLCVCTDYFAIATTTGTYRVATTRANALAATAICLSSAGTGCQTFTPNGAIPTGLSTCTSASFIIRIDDCTIKIASSKANAQAGTAVSFTALNSPALTTFTPTATACDCANGTITFHASVDGSNFACGDEAPTTGCTTTLLNPCMTANNMYRFVDFAYNELQFDICVTEGQWIIDIDTVKKKKRG